MSYTSSSFPEKEAAKVRCECGRMIARTDLAEGPTYVCVCGRGVTPSGRIICRACMRGNCDGCVSWTDEEEICDHECFYQRYYGRPEDIGFITPTDW